ncbi:hypothetical protein BDP27DRAFT_1378748 [Rhodocollybia butyracea]|uniref:Uncharacterized protein n=1 Tax=Rhodocollybia butyracea TaxID=206335 RepID=A0A9P5P2P6_9AGAR|nr:hypothetical protein BDP27DRAFT_1378748 [Rhodocollybia butyracea]
MAPSPKTKKSQKTPTKHKKSTSKRTVCSTDAENNGQKLPSFTGRQIADRLNALQIEKSETKKQQIGSRERLRKIEREMEELKDSLGYLDFRVEALQKIEEELLDLELSGVQQLFADCTPSMPLLDVLKMPNSSYIPSSNPPLSVSETRQQRYAVYYLSRSSNSPLFAGNYDGPDSRDNRGLPWAMESLAARLCWMVPDRGLPDWLLTSSVDPGMLLGLDSRQHEFPRIASGYNGTSGMPPLGGFGFLDSRWLLSANMPPLGGFGILDSRVLLSATEVHPAFPRWVDFQFGQQTVPSSAFH